MFCTRRAQRAQRFIAIRVSRLRWRVANFVTTRECREFIHPLPPLRGTRPCLRGRKLVLALAVVTNCPPETGWTSEAEGVDSPQFSVFHSLCPSETGGRGAKRRRGWIIPFHFLSPLRSPVVCSQRLLQQQRGLLWNSAFCVRLRDKRDFIWHTEDAKGAENYCHSCFLLVGTHIYHEGLIPGRCTQRPYLPLIFQR